MLSGARLAQAVPNIVEDSLLQDAASCAFVIGPPLDSGRRLIAVIDRAWLEFTVGAFERRGMKVRAAWPAQLTLPKGSVLALFVIPCVVGDPAMEFEWFHNDVKIPGAVGTLLVRSNLTEALTGTYRAIVRTQFREAESTECVITLQPTAPLVPLRLKIEPVDSGIRLSWPEAYPLGTAPGFHQLESSADLADWWPLDTEYLQPVLQAGRWKLDLPTLDAESAMPGEFFRIVPWQDPGE
jgi:type II secretion system protein L